MNRELHAVRSPGLLAMPDQPHVAGIVGDKIGHPRSR